jgi:drug/metabolite transporter (DMT)-like permease
MMPSRLVWKIQLAGSVIAGVTFLGERPSAPQFAGVVVIWPRR